jgi:hypothetical protein
MNSFMIDLLLCGITYVILIYLLFELMLNKKPDWKDDDDDGGGVSINNTPEIDLPPGVTLPQGGPDRKRSLPKEEPEEMLV